jgi:hypothetical protein
MRSSKNSSHQPHSWGSRRRIVAQEVSPIQEPQVLADVEGWFGFRRYGYREGQEIGEPALLIARLRCLWKKELNSSFAAHVSLSWSVTHGLDRIRELVREWVSELNAADGTTEISLLIRQESVSNAI